MAQAGHEVLGVDVQESLISRLRNGEVHVRGEEGLVDIARATLNSGALRVSTKPEQADAFVVCVPTPLTISGINSVTNIQDPGTELRASLAQTAATGEADAPVTRNSSDPTSRPTVDLSYVESAVESIASVVRPGNVVIIESTVPPGTTERVVLPIFERYGWSRDEILLAHAPERVIPGSILRELVENDRVVGGLTSDATQAAKDLYMTFVKGQIFTTDATTAEFVKLIENTYRDVNIALANEFARIAERLGVDVQKSIALANRHPRVNILHPGPGVGGHCIPVDPHFLIEQAPELTPLMQTARSVNEGMVDHVVSLVQSLSMKEDMHRWVVLGAAYKANVGDERNSPALSIAYRLTNLGLSIAIHDPFVKRFDRPLESLLRGAEGLLLVTDHSAYRDLDPRLVGQLMARRFIVDTRLCLNAELWRANDFVVRRLGDGTTVRSNIGARR